MSDAYADTEREVARLHIEVAALRAELASTKARFQSADDAYRASRSEDDRRVKAAETERDAFKQAAEAAWRCFHCDAVFTDRAKAEEHFGTERESVPHCLEDYTERIEAARDAALRERDEARRQVLVFEDMHGTAIDERDAATLDLILARCSMDWIKANLPLYAHAGAFVLADALKALANAPASTGEATK
jgi:hypothetical protein